MGKKYSVLHREPLCALKAASFGQKTEAGFGYVF